MLHRSLCPLLDCVRLTALRPSGSGAQWCSTKALGESSTSATKLRQHRETAVANPILQKRTLTQSPHNCALTFFFWPEHFGRRRFKLFFSTVYHASIIKSNRNDEQYVGLRYPVTQLIHLPSAVKFHLS
ncbi:hypothetical protein ILYODFUR_015056 [Ilyodon furcidens]|uniref:Secreted protein n=1 Tax=Ilyodon furcidens TaxID=33524 RepID=A0ABV0T8A8_9TELE